MYMSDAWHHDAAKTTYIQSTPMHASTQPLSITTMNTCNTRTRTLYSAHSNTLTLMLPVQETDHSSSSISSSSSSPPLLPASSDPLSSPSLPSSSPSLTSSNSKSSSDSSCCSPPLPDLPAAAAGPTSLPFFCRLRSALAACGLYIPSSENRARFCACLPAGAASLAAFFLAGAPYSSSLSSMSPAPSCELPSMSPPSLSSSIAARSTLAPPRDSSWMKPVARAAWPLPDAPMSSSSMEGRCAMTVLFSLANTSSTSNSLAQELTTSALANSWLPRAGGDVK
mmetsp:Transcript_4944/g.10635  ORF Transcript_4944/g.10635 Transcript_4944/m.10635 type:complete len:282 (-) Transcript_4944:1345-2190(-)